ncbi:MAG: nucleotidyltransferase domain-containing protein [Patescibacteria group bacterium]
MGSVDRTKIIDDLAIQIAKSYKPEKIILFGSRAWGTPTTDSDVDLFIVKNSSDQRIERARQVREIIWRSGIPVDLLVYTPDEIKSRLARRDFFIRDIMTKGRVLYQAS